MPGLVEGFFCQPGMLLFLIVPAVAMGEHEETEGLHFEFHPED